MILDGALLVLVALAMAGLVAAWIAQPLVDAESPEEAADPRAVALLARREMVLADLRDLEEERRLGRITESTYASRREALVGQGSRILVALDELASSHRADVGELAAALDREIQAAKAAHGLDRTAPERTPADAASSGSAAPGVPMTEPVTEEKPPSGGDTARIVGGLVLLLGWAALAPPTMAAESELQHVRPAIQPTGFQSTAPQPTDTPDAAAGLEAFQQHCAGCHGPFGRGDGELTDRLPAPPPDLSRSEWQATTSPAEIFEVISTGRMDAMMPPFGQSLDAATRWDLTYAVISLHLTPERLVLAEADFGQACAECHSTGDDMDSGEWVASSPSQVAADLGVLRAHDRTNEGALALGLDHLRSQTFQALPTDGLMTGGRLEVSLDAPIDGPPLAGHRVGLVPRVGGLPGRPISATTGADGEVTFDSLVRGPGAEYGVRVEAEGANYVTSTVLVETLQTVPVTIYKTATDVPLSADGVSVLLGPVPDRGIARVVEIWEIRNGESLTRIPDAEGVTFVMPLIPGAQDVTLASPDHFEAASQHPEGVGLGHTVPPGLHEVVVEYVVPYLGTELALDRRLPLPVDLFRVAITGDARVEGADFGPVERGVAGDLPVAAAVAADLSSGQRLEAVIKDLPRAQARTLPQPLPERSVQLEDLSWAGAGLLIVALAVAVAYPALPLSRRDSTTRRRRLGKERRAAIATIVELDSDFAEGELTESEYQTLRTEALARALAVAKEEAALRGEEGQ